MDNTSFLCYNKINKAKEKGMEKKTDELDKIISRIIANAKRTRRKRELAEAGKKIKAELGNFEYTQEEIELMFPFLAHKEFKKPSNNKIVPEDMLLTVGEFTAKYEAMPTETMVDGDTIALANYAIAVIEEALKNKAIKSGKDLRSALPEDAYKELAELIGATSLVTLILKLTNKKLTEEMQLKAKKARVVKTPTGASSVLW